MASHKISKREMKEDQFRDMLSEIYFGSIQHIERHWKSYVGGLAAILILGSGVYFAMYRIQSKSAESSYLLGQVIEAYNAPVEKEKKDPNSSALTFGTQSGKNAEIDRRLAALQAQAGPDGPKGLGGVYKALGQMRAGKASDAVNTLTPLTKGTDLSPIALSLRAGIYEASGQLDKAEADLKALAAYDGKAWPKGEGWYALGQFYERRSQDDKALEAYKNAQNSVASEKADEDPLYKKAKERIDALKGKA